MKPPALAVILHGRPVGTVERTRSGAARLTFDIEPDVPLSLSLPAEETVHTGDKVDRWLAALLPDNDDALAAVERLYGADRREPLSLLAAIGSDCAGAVQFCTPDEVDATIAREGHLEPAPDHAIEQRLGMMAIDRAASWMLLGEHWSLGGTQQKFTLRRRDDAWFFPAGAEASTHIVKPGIRNLHAQALAEHISMAAAAAIGLSAAPTEFVSFGSEDALVVTRFDRSVDAEGIVTRVHQEDLCQALGNPQKYQEYGGPSAADIVQLLRDQSATAAQARVNVDRFVDGLILSTVIGAPDAHGRNYAVLLTADGPRVSPLFDVASGLGYDTAPGTPRSLSMSIGGTYRLDEVDAEAWKRFAGTIRVDEQRILARVQEMAEALPGAVASALDDLGASDQVAGLRERLLPTLRDHAAWWRGALPHPDDDRRGPSRPSGDRRTLQAPDAQPGHEAEQGRHGVEQGVDEC